MKIYKILLLISLLFVGYSYGQKTLIGKVNNYKNKPIVHAKIYLDSIDSKVETDNDGKFELVLPEKVSVINVFSNEYGLLSSKLENENIMNFMFLKKSQKEINEDKISIGYQDVDKKSRTGNSIVVDKNTVVYNSIYDMIRGRLPGVSVSADNKITIRGVSSFYYAAEPLFVVDGVVVSSINEISPINVKSINVLKGSETSIYGARGSSGVIIIKTKSANNN